MNDNERLREALECARRNLHYDSRRTYNPLESIEAATTVIDKALAAEPEVCKWTGDGEYPTSLGCGRWEDMSPATVQYLYARVCLHEKMYCPGCGASIKIVKE